ncbi:phage tail protein [Enterobacter kobei]
MTVKYKTVITKAGAIKLAAATVPNGKKVNFTAMAIGDGGGTLPVPDPNQTKLVKEVWRHSLNKISQDKKNKNYVVAELLIPPETGGFWMREMGLYDDTGTLIAVGNMAESYKPALAEGSGRAQTVRMVIMVSDIESVELTIDTSMVMATQDYVDVKIAEHEQSRRHPDATLTAKGFTQLSNATDSASESVAATPKAVKAAYDLAKAKYTAQDATTAQKGIVQLSSATNSTSESLAATPKAVKAVSDDLIAFKKTLGTSATLDIVAAKDDTTAGRVPVVGWMGLGGIAPRSKQAANSSYDSIPAGLPSGFWSHAVSGGPFAYSFALQQDGGGVNNTRHVIIPADTNGKIAVRWDDGATFRYQYVYTDRNKPTPADVGAVDKKGDTMSGVLKVGAEVQSTSSNGFRMAYGDYGAFWRNDGNNLYLMLTNKGDAFGNYNALRPLRVSLGTGAVVSESPLTVTDTINASKEITAGYSGNYGWANQYDTKAPFFNNYTTAGASEYHPALKQLATINGKNSWAFSMGSLVSGDVISWHLHMKGSGSGDVNFKWDVNGNFSAPGRIYPGNFSNFDDRYIQKDGCYIAGFASGDATRPYMRHAGSSLVVYLAKTGDSYTKTESDNGYAAKTSVYTKAESDGRFQPKGSYGAPNSASKAANGWWQCGSTGIIDQWCQGATMTSETTQTITFPKAFPNACLHVEVGTLNVNNNKDTEGMFQLISKTNTGCVVLANRAYGSVGQVAALIKATGY